MEIAYIEKCVLCGKRRPVEAEAGQGEENPEEMDTVCLECKSTYKPPAAVGEPVKIGALIKKKEFKSTEMPAYKIWNRWVRGEIDKKEFMNLTAKESLLYLGEYKAWTYPMITQFVRRWAVSSGEERHQLRLKEEPAKLKELDGYNARFNEVRAHNYTSFSVLCDLQEALIDSGDKAKIADYVGKEYEPYWKTLHREPYKEPQAPAGEWRTR